MDIPIFCAHTKQEDTAALVPNPRNPNTHPKKQIELLAKIIKAQRWRNPNVVSNRSGFVVKGHGRLAAAQLLGCDKVPVDYQDYANEAIEWADMVADNRIAELAELDDNTLKSVLEDLRGRIDIDLTGFTVPDIEAMLEEKQGGNAESEDSIGDTEGITVSQQYGVIVMCESEGEQEKTYNKLVEMGYTCKVVAV